MVREKLRKFVKVYRTDFEAFSILFSAVFMSAWLIYWSIQLKILIALLPIIIWETVRCALSLRDAEE